MTEHLHPVDLDVDPADRLEALLLDAQSALRELAGAFASVACVDCDPTGEGTIAAGVGLLERYGRDMIDADMVLAQAADTREAMQRVLAVPHCHHHDDD